MSATTLLLGSLVWYALLALAFAYEHNIGKTLYFLGAFVLTVGVFIME